MKSNRLQIVNIVTSSLSVRFLDVQSEYLAERGYETVIVSSPGAELEKLQTKRVSTVEVPMARTISLGRDLVSLVRLTRAMIDLRPTITNVATPKAGLLGGIAAWLCRVPCRYYTLHGLRCETTTGVKRKVLLLSERIACLCAQRVICVSKSLRQKAIDLRVVDGGRTVVLGSGSCNGVDAKRFAPTAEASRRASRIREELGIAANAPVVGFVGRLTRDKGISELVEAYCELRKERPELRLLLVGELEEGDPLPDRIRTLLEKDPGIVRTGFVADAADYYHVLDVFAFPTYREGFGNVTLEAHAAGKPVVAARATGVPDAVIDGVTGLVVPVGDARALASALKRVIQDRKLAAALGAAGRERALREFRPEMVWDALAEEYARMLEAKGLRVPAANTNPARAPLNTAAVS